MANVTDFPHSFWIELLYTSLLNTKRSVNHTSKHSLRRNLTLCCRVRNGASLRQRVGRNGVASERNSGPRAEILGSTTGRGTS